MEAMTQMNVRIPVQLKQEGDKGLAELGLTPSQAVRRLYELVVRKPRDQMREMLATPEETDEQARERESGLRALEEFRSWQKEMHVKMGISWEVDPDAPSYETLKEAALLERFGGAEL